MNRRSLLTAIPLAGAALVTPMLPVAASEPPPFDLQGWLDGLPPIDRANYHQMKLAEALCEVSPGKWRTEISPDDHDFVLIVRDKKTAPEAASVFVRQIT